MDITPEETIQEEEGKMTTDKMGTTEVTGVQVEKEGVMVQQEPKGMGMEDVTT